MEFLVRVWTVVQLVLLVLVFFLVCIGKSSASLRFGDSFIIVFEIEAKWHTLFSVLCLWWRFPNIFVVSHLVWCSTNYILVIIFTCTLIVRLYMTRWGLIWYYSIRSYVKKGVRIFLDAKKYVGINCGIYLINVCRFETYCLCALLQNHKTWRRPFVLKLKH